MKSSAETRTPDEHHGLLFGLLGQLLRQLPVGVLESGPPPGDVILCPAVQGQVRKRMAQDARKMSSRNLCSVCFHFISVTQIIRLRWEKARVS